MRVHHAFVLSSALLLAACASDGTSSPNNPGPSSDSPIESRLVAITDVSTAVLTANTVTMRVTVTSALTENVSGGVCASAVEARTPSATTWSDVTSAGTVCTLQAALLVPGGTLSMSATADLTKLRAVAGGTGSQVILRARQSLNGTSATYTLQTTDVVWQLP
jgi:hypothetical protein